MNLKQIEAFVKVADTGSFSKAARDLYLTQPTISAHITSLEKELKARLFVRNTKEVRLSEDGEVLYQYAHRILILEKRIEEIFMEKSQKTAMEVRIASSSIPAHYLLPDILAGFQKAYPKEAFRLMETDSARVVDIVSENLVDIGFTGTKIDKKNCRYISLCKDELAIIMPNTEKYRRIQEVEKGISWLQKEPVMMREKGSGTRREAERCLKNAGVSLEKLNIIASIESTETIKRSVQNGIGVTVLSRLAAEEEINSGKVLEFPMDKEKNSRELYLVYNKEIPLSPAAEKFLKMVKAKYQIEK